MEKTEKQKEVEANEIAAENNIYCENDRVVRKYYQVRIKKFFRKLDANLITGYGIIEP